MSVAVPRGEAARPSRNRQIVGNVGMYYVCYRLSQIGLNVMPTSRNARGIDIIAYGEGAGRFTSIQVKSLSSRNDVSLGMNLDSLQGDYWAIITNVFHEPQAYILTIEEVKGKAAQDKGGQHAYWLPWKTWQSGEFRERWDRIEDTLANRP